MVGISGNLPIGAQQDSADDEGSLWLDISLGPPLIEWFNEVARPNDIARIERVGQIELLNQITTGRKLVIFKSVGEAEATIPTIADRFDIIGYNLEQGNLNADADKADPVSSAIRMRELADEHGLMLAFGPDHDFALSDGVAIAPYVDIFVLQVQRVQTSPQTVYDFVLPLIPQLREVNPDLQVSVQIRTEGDVAEIGSLIVSLQDHLDGVSVLTSPETITIAHDMVGELQSRTSITPLPTGMPYKPSIGVVFIGVLGGVIGLFIVFSRQRR